jgi:PDZ domain-containing protein
MPNDQISDLDAPPPEPPDAVVPDAPDAPRSGGFRWRRWMSWVTATAVLVLLVIIVGSAVRLPYYTISPGSAVNLLGDVSEDKPRITVDGADSYPTDDQIMLLFVRESARVNVWEWIQASLDPDIDLFKEAQFTGGLDPEEVRVESDADMARSQLAAKRLALEAAGYDVPVGDGVTVLAVAPSRPAADVLKPGDVLLEVDGQKLEAPDTLSEIVKTHKAGDTVEVLLERDGKQQTVEVPTEAGDDGSPIIGVYVSGRYDFPIDVDVDTSSIGGPSAGLAMTLSIFDTLTPGDLTGGKKVAVTGTIAEDGSVGEIGGISQKATSAKAAGAEVFIVPACTREDIQTECERDLAKAKARAGDLEVIPVATFDDALEALEGIGGEPVTVAPKVAA